MDQPFNTVAQELNSLDTKSGNLKTLNLMYQAFLESPLANSQEERIKGMELYKCLKQLF